MTSHPNTRTTRAPANAPQFLPYTHTSDAHLMWNAAGKSPAMKERFISLQPAMQARVLLGRGAALCGPAAARSSGLAAGRLARPERGARTRPRAGKAAVSPPASAHRAPA
jgi:hypothetical protein